MKIFFLLYVNVCMVLVMLSSIWSDSFRYIFSFFYVPHTKNAVGCQDMIVGPNSSRSIKVTLFPFRLHFWTTSTIFHDGRCRPASTFRPARCWTYLDANAGIEFRIRKEADSTLNLFVSVFFIFSSPGSFIFRYRLCAILAYRLNGARYRTFEFIWILETSPLFSHDGKGEKVVDYHDQLIHQSGTVPEAKWLVDWLYPDYRLIKKTEQMGRRTFDEYVAVDRSATSAYVFRQVNGGWRVVSSFRLEIIWCRCAFRWPQVLAGGEITWIKYFFVLVKRAVWFIK